MTKLALELLGPDASLWRRERAVRRLLAVPAAPEPRQHDRGGHVGGPPQHRRRARARPPQVALGAMDFTVHTRAGRAPRAGARRSSRRPPSRPGRSSPSSAGRASRSPRSTAAPGSRSSRRPCSSRSSAARCSTAPYFVDVVPCLPFLPGDDQAAVAAGEASWTLALGPLVPDLDTATRVAVVGGDSIYELEGFEREVLTTSDETRPLGVVSRRRGGPCARIVRRAARDPGALADDRSRSRPCGVGARALELAIEYVADARAVRPAHRRRTRRSRTRSRRVHAEIELSRSLACGRRGASPTTTRRRRSPRRRRRPTPADAPCSRASARSRRTAGSASPGSTCCTGCTSARSGSESFGASGTRLRAEVAATLLEAGGGIGASPTLRLASRKEAACARPDDGLPAQRPGDPAPRRRALRRPGDRLAACPTRAGTATRTRTSSRARSGSRWRSGASASRTATASARSCGTTTQHLETYIGAPVGGFVTHTLNLRLHPDDNTYIATHAGDRVLVVDKVLWPLAEQFVDRVRLRARDRGRRGRRRPTGTIDYEELLAAADESAFAYRDIDERAAAAMCYTSGTTGLPKGVVYSHRAIAIHALTRARCSASPRATSCLPVVPMFHANAWCFPFTCTLVGAKQVFPGPHLDPAEPARGLRGRSR